MAAVDVTISGVLYDKLNRTMQQVVLIGEASLTGLGVGGGPIPPGGQPPSGGGQPPYPAHPIWPGGPPPHPEHPIPPVIWPTPPGGQPPSGGAPPHPSHPIYPGEHPEHPIELPPPGSKPPEPIQPPVDWKAVWTPNEGWFIVGIPNVPHPAPSATP